MNGSVSTSLDTSDAVPASHPPAGRPASRPHARRREARMTGAPASLMSVNADPTVLLTPPGQELLARLAAEPDGAGTPLALAVRLRQD